MKITVRINVVSQSSIDMGLDEEAEVVECSVDLSKVCCFYKSYDNDSQCMGTRIHFDSGEQMWCYEDYEQIKKHWMQ